MESFFFFITLHFARPVTETQLPIDREYLCRCLYSVTRGVAMISFFQEYYTKEEKIN